MEIKNKLTSTSSRRKTAGNSSQRSVETGIKVIETAIKNEISLTDACRKHKLHKNYVYDVKYRINGNFENKRITRDLYRTFNRVLKQYEKMA